MFMAYFVIVLALAMLTPTCGLNLEDTKIKCSVCGPEEKVEMEICGDCLDSYCAVSEIMSAKVGRL